MISPALAGVDLDIVDRGLAVAHFEMRSLPWSKRILNVAGKTHGRTPGGIIVRQILANLVAIRSFPIARRCYVRDVSANGAGVCLYSTKLLPLEFDLVIEGSRMHHRCRLAWRWGDFARISCDPSDPLCRQGGLPEQELKKYAQRLPWG